LFKAAWEIRPCVCGVISDEITDEGGVSFLLSRVLRHLVAEF